MKMKRSLITLICILCTLSILLCGCSNKEAPEGYHNAAGEHEAFYFYVPTTWTLNNTGGTASAYYSSSDMSNVSMTCMVIEPGEMDTLETYKSVSISELEAVLPDFKIVETPAAEDTSAEGTGAADETGAAEENKPVTIDGRETISFEYECTLSGKTYRYMQVVTLKGDMFYLFTYTALAENYESHLEDVSGILENIKFK